MKKAKLKYLITVITIFFSLISHAKYYYEKHSGFHPLKSKKGLDVTDEKIFNRKNYTRMGYKTMVNSNMILGGELVFDDIDFKKLIQSQTIDDIKVDLLMHSSYSIYDGLDLYGKIGFTKNTSAFNPKMVIGTSYAFNENLSLHTNITSVKRNNVASTSDVSSGPFGEENTAALGFKLKW